MFHHICDCPASSYSLSIPSYFSRDDLQLHYPFIPFLGGVALYERPLYRLLLFYSHILPYQYLLPITYFFQTSRNITSSDAMFNGFPSSSCNMDRLLVPFFPRANINNTIHFLTSIPESVVDAN